MGLQDPQMREVGYILEYPCWALGHKIPHIDSVISRWLACVTHSVLNTGKCAST